MTQIKKSEFAHRQFANQRINPWNLFLRAWLILSSIPFPFFLWTVKKFCMKLREYFIAITHSSAWLNTTYNTHKEGKFSKNCQTGSGAKFPRSLKCWKCWGLQHIILGLCATSECFSSALRVPEAIRGLLTLRSPLWVLPATWKSLF